MSSDRFVVIDEIQKVPALLDEVHWLIENHNVTFALCGSSARKVRRGHANLLGGRALSFELHGLVSAELGNDFDIVRAVNNGYLPRHYLTDSPQSRIRSYVENYLAEEIAAEALTRNLPAFADFLTAAALADGQLVNYTTIARDCSVSAYTAKEYFQILVATLLGGFLPAYRRRPKRRVIQSPKFYFSDVGVVNHLASRGRLEPGSQLFGLAFENWVFHELNAYRAYRDFGLKLSYWRLASGIEVDFIIGEMTAAIEAKATSRIQDRHLKGLRELAVDHSEIGQRMVVSLDSHVRRSKDGILLLPADEFVKQLWRGELLPG